MSAPNLTPLVLLIILATLPSTAPAQKKSAADDVRDAFLVTRVKATADKQDKPAKANPATGRKLIVKTNSSIGLGYTVYQRDASGNPVRASQSREFHQGDAVRLVVESNIDGYLYVFHTENDGQSQMIFPDARLNEGRNNIAAHVPYEVPSSREANPNLRWFIFDEKPATERLYLVVTKRPLPGVPIGNELVAYCRTNAGACPWRPAEAAWTQLAANVNSVREEKSGEFGQMQTAVERDAVERGLGLGLDAPAPSVIRMSKSPQAKQLVTMVALIHK